MKSYRMVCLDIDGTLINSKHEISQATKNSIKKIVKENDVIVALVSARMPDGISYLLKELEISAPIICYNGSFVLDMEINNDAQLLYSNTINQDKAREIYENAKINDIHVSFYRDNKWYIEKTNNYVKEEIRIVHVKPCMVNLNDLISNYHGNIGLHKIMCMGDPDKIKAFYDRLKEDYNNQLNICISKPTYIEITEKTASKITAIRILQHHYDISTSEIIAIGDNYNDLDMIENVGLGVAMGNAPEDVRKRAKEVTLSNDDDGVAEVIKKYFK